MIKIIFTFLVSAFGMLSYAQTPICLNNTAPNPGTQTGISDITFNNLSNSSLLEEGYIDNTGLVPADVFRATIDTIQIVARSCHPTRYQLGIWVDWNQDGDLLDANEEIINEFIGTGVAMIPLVIPMSAQQGLSVMRVIVSSVCEPSISGPCNSILTGDVEDYLVNVKDRDMVFDSMSVEEYDYQACQAKGSQEQPLLRITVNTTGGLNPIRLISMNFNTATSTNPSGDIDLAELYYSTNEYFTTPILIGSFVEPNGAFNINTNQVLVPNSNNKHYFWLTYDINTNATSLNTIDATNTQIELDSNGNIFTVVSPSPSINTNGITICPDVEICNNGIDDDGNGFTDCYDNKCPDCFSFINNAPDCIDTNIIIEQLWQSTIEVSDRQTVLSGDVDGDGDIEIVAYVGFLSSEIKIFDGNTGVLEQTIDFGENFYQSGENLAMADVDNDGIAEIFAFIPISTNSIYYRLHCYRSDGTFIFISADSILGITNHGPSIVDFNYDGTAEVLVGNSIFNASNGNLISSYSGGSRGKFSLGFGASTTFSVAADILPDMYCPNCDGMEIIAGNTVYIVDITNGNVKPMVNNLPVFAIDGLTSIADMNGDGQLDVVVTSDNALYIWDPRNAELISNIFDILAPTVVTGRPTLANLDSDIFPEIVVAGNEKIYVLDYDPIGQIISIKWSKDATDGSSITSSFVFNLDGYQTPEVIYRDEDSIYIYEGTTGKILSSFVCLGGTATETPIVVDVNQDGEANIVCICKDLFASAYGKIKVLKSANYPWMKTRSVFNQHAYTITNINDDLTIPSQQQSPILYNTFLSQPVLSSPFFLPEPDLLILIDSIDIDCANIDSVEIFYYICNQGVATSAPSTPISFYSGNPTDNGNLIFTTWLADSIEVDSCISGSTVIPYISGQIYIMFNDSGNNPTQSPVYQYSECDFDNNIDSTYIPLLPNPDISLDSPICINQTNVLLTAIDTGGFWSSNVIDVFNGTASFDIQSNGIGSFEVTYTIDSICIFSDTIIVVVNDLPFIDAGADQTIFKGETISLMANGGINYSWSPNDLLSCTNCSTPNLITFSELLLFVTGIDANGCQNKDSINIFVKDPILFVPNSFSPNNDGVNDVFSVRGEGIAEILIKMYDRWGNLVFQSTDINQGWDGSDSYRNNNGNISNEGVYVYNITGKYIGGLDISLKGNVSLVR